MANGVRSGRRRLLQRGDELPADEDFLFHLSRGSELLIQNRVVEAKEALERAISHRPTDAQSQDLLAGTYFRLGIYPSAISLWSTLADDFPDDPTLRVNLGLALFKTGQPGEAREHLEAAIEIEPDHERAWGYLGLVYWRLGKLDLAREAFLRGGQLTMARRMEEQSSAEPVRASSEPEPAPPEAESNVDDEQISAMRDAVAAAAEQLSSGGRLWLEREQETSRPSGGWSVVETGAARWSRVRRHSRPISALSPPMLGAIAESWALELPHDTPLAVGPEGELLVSSRGSIHARLSGLRVVRGPLRTEPVVRRYRARGSTEALGGEDEPIVRWNGPVAGVLRPPAGVRFVAIRVDETLLYVLEELVLAFDDRVGFESGRLPLAGRSSVLLSFHGEGIVVLRLSRSPSGLEVGVSEEVLVDPDALIGWTGRLFPSEVKDPEPPNVTLAFKGQGIVLVT